MLYINNANSPYSEQRVSLGGFVYTLILKYNSRNESWYLTLKDSSGEEELLSGIKLAPNQSLTNRYLLEDFSGNLMCLRVKNNYTPLNRDNLGREGVYRLVWLSEEESTLVGVNNIVQLS